MHFLMYRYNTTSLKCERVGFIEFVGAGTLMTETFRRAHMNLQDAT